MRTWWQRRSGFLPGFRHQCNKVRRKEGSGQGWLVKTQVFLLTQINSHRCALCVTRTHQLSRLSQRSLSVFVPTASLWQLVRPSLHSVSLNELPFHGGFYPVSTPITAIRHRWSSFCTWPTYLPLSPESFSRCRLRWTTPPSQQCHYTKSKWLFDLNQLLKSKYSSYIHNREKCLIIPSLLVWNPSILSCRKIIVIYSPTVIIYWC